MIFIYQWTVFCFLCFFENCISANFNNISGMRIPHSNHTSVGSRQWTQWTEWSDCSRTCGGGIRTRTRVCRIRLIRHISSRDTCVGRPSEQELCSKQNCSPHDKDFLEYQCSQRNGQTVRGKQIEEWFPYPRGENPCELQCWSKDRSVVHSFGKTIDGTICPATDAKERALCVNGRCSPIDCAGNIGLVKRRDKCGICGGDNSTCVKYENIFWRRPRNKMLHNGNKDIHYDYEEIFRIPAGATNILVSEASRTNFLSLSDHKGNYFINGNWRVQTPGQFIVHGSEFVYNRTWDGVEFLSSTGPTRQLLIIFVLGSGDIPTIHYEYWISTIDNPTLPQHLKANYTIIKDSLKNHPDHPIKLLSHSSSDLSSTSGTIVSLPRIQGYNSYYHRNEILKSVPSWSSKRQSSHKRPWNRPPYSVQNNVSIREYNHTKLHHYSEPSGQYSTSWKANQTKTSPNINYLVNISPRDHVSVGEIVPLSNLGRPNGTSAQMSRNGRLLEYEVNKRRAKIHTLSNNSDNENIRKVPQKANKRKLKLQSEQPSRNKRKRKSSNENCSPCSKVKQQTKNFCLSEFVLRAVILSSEKHHQSKRFEIEVVRSYKNKVPILPREYIWTTDNCECPKLRSGREYIVMGYTKTFGNQRESRLVVDGSSFVRKYSQKRARALLRLVRDQNNKCRKFYRNKS